MKLLECSETTEKNYFESFFTNRVGLARLLSPEHLHTKSIVTINIIKNSGLQR